MGSRRHPHTTSAVRRFTGPLPTIAVVAGVSAVVVVSPLALFAIIGAVASAPTIEQRFIADTSADATCFVEPAIRGSTTMVTFPLERLGGEAGTGKWRIQNVVINDGTNALISSTKYIGAPPHEGVQFAVRPLIPGREYAIDGLLVRVVNGDDQRVQTMRLALTADDSKCTVGVGSEIWPLSD